jgi:predicted MFS family arabinose efflux permease
VTAGQQGAAFRRDAPTVLCYAALVGYAFWLYAFGPALALLRAEQGFSYTLIGVCAALWAAGAVLVGVSFAAIARRLSRGTLLWGSAAVASAGACLFAVAHGIAAVLLGAAVLGFAGTTLLTCTQAILSDRHGERRDRALTEANVGAAACAVLAPLLLGLLPGPSVGWRAAMGLPVVVLAVLYVRYRRQPLPAGPGIADPEIAGRARLPLACWLLAALTAAGVAAEFCIVYFGTELLTAAGLRAAAAATAMTSLYAGILAGRVGGAWLTRRAGRAVPLLWVSLALTAAGFLVFWLGDRPAVMIAGLFWCGLGVANLYPLSLAVTLAAAPGSGDTAQARTQLLVGCVGIAAPYLLGSLADRLGLHAAFTIEPALIAVSAGLLVAGLRLAHRVSPGARPGGQVSGTVD